MSQTAMLIIWIIVTAFAVFAEAITTQLVAIWFMPAGIVAAILASCEVEIVYQIVVFCIISIVGVIISLVFLRKLFRKNETKTNIDAIIGQTCIVIEKIDNLSGCGQVRVKGQVWSARSYSDDISFEIGQQLSILAIEGVKVICK